MGTRKKYVLIFLFFFLFIQIGFSEYVFLENTDSSIKPLSETWITANATVASASAIPFWLDKGVQGILADSTDFLAGIGYNLIIPIYADDVYFQIYSEIYEGMDGKIPTIAISSLYTRLIFYDALELAFGKYPVTSGLNPAGLSSGSLILSGNNPSYPVIYAGTKDFLNIPFTAGILQTRFHFSYGVLEDVRYVKNPLLQTKSLYGKVNLPFGFSIMYGLVHAAFWGGDSPVYGDLPSDLDTFWRVFFAEEGNESAPENEQINRVGDHKGMWDYGIQKAFTDFSILLYYQHFFEDNSGRKYWNEGEKDGLWGVAIQGKNRGYISAICYEYYNSTNQSGTGAHNVTGGQDFYYENYIYKTGWTYMGVPLGTPFIITSGNGSDIDYIHTRARVHYVSVHGFFNESISYNLQLAIQRYYGTYADYNVSTGGNSIFKDGLPQTSVALYVLYSKLFNLVDASIGLCLDVGNARDDSFGLRILVKYDVGN
ncbi:MAG TPA: capsule assembly Wzi family protein [Spirochaetales bacterium]|nr:capsule assembly Wzi family protein [Spirochaetales bacterium]